MNVQPEAGDKAKTTTETTPMEAETPQGNGGARGDDRKRTADTPTGDIKADTSMKDVAQDDRISKPKFNYSSPNKAEESEKSGQADKKEKEREKI